LSIDVIGASNETVPAALSDIKNSKAMHPYLIMYPDALLEYKRSTKTPSQAAIDHYNTTGKNNSDYINPYRMLALIHNPYFNFYPDAEKEYNDNNPANATNTESYSYSSGEIFAQDHHKAKVASKISGYRNPQDAKKSWQELINSKVNSGLPVKLSKTTKNYEFKIDKLGQLPATLPYTFQVDGDKSDNVVTCLIFIETPPLPGNQVVVPDRDNRVPVGPDPNLPDCLVGDKDQPVPKKSLKVTPNTITSKEDLPIMLTIEGEPNDQIYVDYFDPRIPDDATFIEYNLDLYNEWQANSKVYIDAGFTLTTASNAAYNNFGKAEGRLSPAECLALEKNWRATVGKKRYCTLDSSGTKTLDISLDVSRAALRHRRTPYSWKITGDNSVGSEVVSVTIEQPPLKKVSATAKTQAKLLVLRKWFVNSDLTEVIFYIGDIGETVLPKKVLITVIESNSQIVLKDQVVFNYPEQQSFGSVITPDIVRDSDGSHMGGKINTSPVNLENTKIVFRIRIESEGGVWESSESTNPPDLVYYVPMNIIHGY
jgi:hypothetical protein